ncbi:MAG: hypothetical protein KDC85_10350 [Saprospiraceae bacterium]|nr:hypothetical protein [Saprospiraceae bacterium]MCB9325745.1 hypothetical protein [Lewinellaceae bacterium]
MYLKLFAHNKLVRGKDKSCIYDLHNNDVVLIPNIFYDILNDLPEHSIEAIQKQYAPDEPEVFDQYVQFILNKNLGFTTHEPRLFGELDTSWEQPHHIQNGIVEHRVDSPFELSRVILKLDELLCRQIELRILPGEQPIDELTAQLTLLNGKVFRNVTLFLKYNASMTAEKVATLYNEIPNLGFVLLFNSPETREVPGCNGKALFSSRPIEDFPFESEAGFKEKYIVNITYFMEALQFNPYYNRKVAIDHLGNIKNDLMLQPSFGNINDLDLKEVIATPEFRELWYASPDKIIGVRDSALRYCRHLPYALRKVEDGNYEIVV